MDNRDEASLLLRIITYPEYQLHRYRLWRITNRANKKYRHIQKQMRKDIKKLAREAPTRVKEKE